MFLVFLYSWFFLAWHYQAACDLAQPSCVVWTRFCPSSQPDWLIFQHPENVVCFCMSVIFGIWNPSTWISSGFSQCLLFMALPILPRSSVCLFGCTPFPCLLPCPRVIFPFSELPENGVPLLLHKFCLYILFHFSLWVIPSLDRECDLFIICV